jgi:hypothetical protein
MFLLLFTVVITNTLLISYFCVDYFEYFLINVLVPFINQIYKIKNIKKNIEIKVFSNFDDDIKERINEIINSLGYDRNISDSNEDISDSSEDISDSSEDISDSSEDISDSSEDISDSTDDILENLSNLTENLDYYENGLKVNNIYNDYCNFIKQNINNIYYLFGIPIIEEVNEPVIEEVNEPVIDEINEPVIDEINEPVIDEINEPIIEEVNEPVINEINEPVINEINEPVIDEINEPVIDEINEPVIDERNIIQYDEATESEDSIELNDVDSESVNSDTIVIEKVD